MDEAHVEKLRAYLKELEARHKKTVAEMKAASGESTLIYRFSQGAAAALKEVMDELRNIVREFAQGDTDEVPTDQ